MHGFKGERVLMRLHVEEQDRYKGRPLYRAILEMLRQRHFAGATVFQGTLGFGPSGHVHEEHTWTIREDLPMVIEVIDTDEKIQAVLPDIRRHDWRRLGDARARPRHHVPPER